MLHAAISLFCKTNPTPRRLAPCGLLILCLLLSACSRPPAAAASTQPATQPARHEGMMAIAFGSCAHQDKPQPIWDAILAARPDLFIFLGDNIYADTDDMSVMRTKYQQLAAVPAFQKLRQTTRLLATWDDHDFGVNDGGCDYPQRDESQKCFLEFFSEPPDSPRWRRPGVYDAQILTHAGHRIQVILLDTRFFRTPLKPMDPPRRVYDPKNPAADKDGYILKPTGRNLPNPDPAATLLGQAQWQWLEEQLRIPADLRILASSIQFVADDQPWEKWGNFPLEQKRFYELVRKTQAGHLLIISGDRHRAEISRLKGPLPYPLYDITSSGLNQSSSPDKQNEPNRHRLGPNYVHVNFGLLTIDWAQTDPTLRMEIRNLNGQPVLCEEAHLSTLRFFTN